MDNKKQLFKGLAFLFMGAFLLICVLVLENSRKTNTSNIELLAYKVDNKEHLTESDVLNVLKKETGVIYFTNNEYQDIDDLFQDLSERYKVNSYIYDLSNDEVKLVLESDKKVIEKQSASKFYKELLNQLGSFVEDYNLFNKKGKAIKTDYKKIVLPYAVFVIDGKVIYSQYVNEEFLEKYTLKDLETSYRKGFELLQSK